MIAILGSSILDEIIRRVKEAKFCAIIADETPDMSSLSSAEAYMKCSSEGKVSAQGVMGRAK